MFGLIVVMLAFFMVLVLWGVVAIIGNGYGIQGQNYVALLRVSEMSAAFHHGNAKLGI